MYQGIFVKEFLLFYDEILEYYLTVELPDDTRQTEKKLLTMEESLQEGNTKYQLINQMLAGRKLGRREQTEKAMEQYLHVSGTPCVIHRWRQKNERSQKYIGRI